MRRIYVHVGAHKTASSLIRNNLAAQRPALAERGLRVLLRAELVGSDFGKEVYEVSQGRHAAGEVSPEAARSLRALLRKGGDVLMANEDMICHLDVTDFYQNAEAAVRHMAVALDGHDLTVILYLRRQADYIESIYMQYVHLGRRLKFDQFLERMEGVDLSWLRAAGAIARALPPDRLRLRAYETIRERGETGFFRDYLGLCGVAAPEDFAVDPDLAGGRAANRSYGDLGMRIALRVNPMLNPQERKLFRSFLQENFSTATHPRAELLGEARRAEVFERYRASNRELFETRDLGGADGAALGYY